ncbi:MAG: glycosyltransferase, partial [Bacteroidota bacterium]|nr:glycosyltransferase [Bacteroidota bacterium]
MLFLLLLCLTCRFPFFFRDIHDWDESTFLLVGQSLLDGHLPFTKLWDLKPALLGYVYALIVFFSGKSIFLVRL